MTRRIVPALGLAALTLAACGGGGLSGTYRPREANAFLDQMVFVNGGKVLLTRWGQTQEGTFQQNGREVTIVNSGQSVSLTLDDKGCLEHPLMGSFCKGEGLPGGSGGGNGDAGTFPLEGTWRAGFAGNAIQLEFRPGSKVQVTLTENGSTSMSAEGSYQATDGGVTLQLPDGPPLELARKGSQLEGNMNGTVLTFTKQ